LGEVHGGEGVLGGFLGGGVIHGPTALQTQGDPGRGARRGRPLSHAHMISTGRSADVHQSFRSVSTVQPSVSDPMKLDTLLNGRFDAHHVELQELR
jgi:hypothetical protein